MQLLLERKARAGDDLTVVVLGPDGDLDPGIAAQLDQPLRETLGSGDERAGIPGTQEIRIGTAEGMHRVVMLRPEDDSLQGLCQAFLSAASRGLLAGSLTIHGPWVGTGNRALRAAAEGLLLGGYRFTAYQSRPRTDMPTAATFVVGDIDDLQLKRSEEAIETAKLLADATNWARTLVDTPPEDSTPDKLARLIGDRLSGDGVGVRVWSTDELSQRSFGGILGVGRGSAHGPCLLELTLESGDDTAPIVLCGKGVTFDAGGLSIKNDRTQQWMKADMGGAAAVAAAVDAAARAELPVNLTALLPLVENLPSAHAIRPGDVLRHPDGSTTEVTNTDAEGRLILADALSYANTLGPSVVLDVATLTSGLLGRNLWMLFSRDDELAKEMLAAGHDAGEPGWRMPLQASGGGPLQSSIADRKNYSFENAGVDTLSAAAYLRGFTGNAPWAHLDIVGTAFRQVPDHWPAGATGSPTRALLTFLQGRALGRDRG
ncbi:MAG TPA: leucyl aminopeptidase family protein [Nocardioidaceae bacterium]|jgi:leucyl aminopeptidase|nr:leucyl aminopeptidase family protein [Nocardioidaceae bacterium]